MNYKIIRSNRKTLGLEITLQGEIIVRAPRRVSEKQIERFVSEKEKWIQQAQYRQKLRRDNHPEPDEQRKRELIEKAENVIPQKVEYFGNIMNLHPQGFRITGAKTRFGSCSAKNRLCFSWRLMDYPEEAIDYVVVHELAHIRYKNHGPLFYQLISTVLPDYRIRIQMLKR